MEEQTIQQLTTLVGNGVPLRKRMVADYNHLPQIKRWSLVILRKYLCVDDPSIVPDGAWLVVPEQSSMHCFA
ncbi:hypothetical protein DL89DRAFT_269371 [Linderina pennispora]|uniref:Uncharacterized protein n=1 Tax=Linderina pennispora TaxID=61395 RepID=A0A1Y1W207_9FUNG|nr:uncharacterized protein DL89DRAFT_269371 [Linderina pennispora]ORX67579.1 hypothetical protein DL89DRAFT_269371 [Linderina pennispora]